MSSEIPGAPTVGVEEEFFLVDPEGRLLPYARRVADSGRRVGNQLDLELKTAQIETNTPACHDMRELRQQITDARGQAARAAAEHGAGVLATGVAPARGQFADVTATSRYTAMAARYGELALEHEVCGCHVHVEVEGRATAVKVGNHLRMWLPTLLALTANSPLYQGRDTGFASWRAMMCCRWPCYWAPPHFDSVAQYDAAVAAMIQSGVLLDEAMTFWDVRPSAHLPTVEVRVSDVPATVEETVLLATLVRALVTRAQRDIQAGASAAAVSPHMLRAAYHQAARVGLAGDLIDPVSSTLASSAQCLAALVSHVRRDLADSGDLDAVIATVEGLLAGGDGATRQRELFARDRDISDVITALCWQPPELG